MDDRTPHSDQNGSMRDANAEQALSRAQTLDERSRPLNAEDYRQRANPERLQVELGSELTRDEEPLPPTTEDGLHGMDPGSLQAILEPTQRCDAKRRPTSALSGELERKRARNDEDVRQEHLDLNDEVFTRHPLTGKFLITCPICEATLSLTRPSPSLFERHKRRHRAKEHQCGKCFKTFARQDELMRHKSTHDKANYRPCPGCGHLFRDKSALQEHLRSVSNRSCLSAINVQASGHDLSDISQAEAVFHSQSDAVVRIDPVDTEESEMAGMLTLPRTTNSVEELVGDDISILPRIQAVTDVADPISVDVATVVDIVWPMPTEIHKIQLTPDAVAHPDDRRPCLRQALDHAKEAVFHDGAERHDHAVSLYTSCCDLLIRAVAQTPHDADRRELEAVNIIYLERIRELEDMDLKAAATSQVARSGACVARKAVGEVLFDLDDLDEESALTLLGTDLHSFAMLRERASQSSSDLSSVATQVRQTFADSTPLTTLPTPYEPCEICDCVLGPNQAEIYKHMRKHVYAREPGRWKCQTCGVRSTFRQDMEQHQAHKTVDGERECQALAMDDCSDDAAWLASALLADLLQELRIWENLRLFQYIESIGSLLRSKNGSHIQSGQT